MTTCSLSSSFFRARLSSPLRHQTESSAFVDCHVVGFITLDEVLRHFPCRVMYVSLEVRL